MAANIQDVVRLPSSGIEFCSIVSTLEDLAGVSSAKQETCSPSLQKIIKYSGSALKAGRPYNKVMIVLAGESAVGKKSTIKTLFNDETCFTDTEGTQTLGVTEYGRELCVTDENPPVKGILSFVTLPGSFHSDDLTESAAAITMFREQHPDLLPRSSMPAIEKLCSLTVREQVYPNAVLMITRATDKIKAGPNSNFQKSLQALKEKNFLDQSNNNLIVVVTHAMNLDTELYKAKVQKIVRNIRKAVLEVLETVDADIVFIENMPKDFNMKKPYGSDFYKLPDSQLSHYNLLQVLLNQFRTAEDWLGILLCGWYFSDDRRLEKGQNKTSTLYKVVLNTFGNKKASKSQHFLYSISQSAYAPTFQFQNLGRGYCPRTEALKTEVMYFPIATKVCEVYGRQYVFPESVKVSCKEDDYFYLLTQEHEGKYIKEKIDSYDLSEEGINLHINVDSTGRWVKNSASDYNNSTAVFVYEKRLISVKLDNLVSVAKRDLISEIMQLPESYESSNFDIFHEFFIKWGSHFIYQEWLGGSIEVETPLNGKTFDDQYRSRISKAMETYFTHPDTPQYDDDGVSIVMKDEMIKTYGGDNTGMNILADIRLERLSNWVASVKSQPTELNHSFQLYPYYKLVNTPQHASLKKATLDYLLDWELRI